MRIAIGSDHRGVDYKEFVIGLLTNMGYTCKDFGAYNAESVDYPDIAQTVTTEVISSRCDRGDLICGTGIGMSIASNKVKGIRAALCHDKFDAQRARQHNDANVICLGAERGISGVKEILETFFNTKFEGGRHQRRLDKIKIMESLFCNQ
jgi:ribose 5-phosphate isomerase B